MESSWLPVTGPNSSLNLKPSWFTTVKVQPKYLSSVMPSYMSGSDCSL